MPEHDRQKPDLRVLVTGGAGFIGFALIHHLLDRTEAEVLNLDKLTYAAHAQASQLKRPRYRFEQADICDKAAVAGLLAEFRPRAVIHLAAESHVDASIHGPNEFLRTNVLGTASLLEVALAYWEALETDARSAFRFHHVSTDEVYGDLPAGAPPFTESSPYRPSNPYSASKAASDHLVRAWNRTYGLPTVVSNCSNNYGPRQFPEKLIPLTITNAIAGKPVPIYGDGQQIRDWLYVEDHAEALLRVLSLGRVGETYNIGGRSERRNFEVVRQICSLLDESYGELRAPDLRHFDDLVTFVPDRPGHDRRYAIDNGKVAQELGWEPRHSFESGLRRTVQWYVENADWRDPI